MAKTESDAKRELIAVQNRKARHDYEIMGRYETGMSCAVRRSSRCAPGALTSKDSFALVERGEIFLHNVHIAQYEPATASTTTRSAYANCSCTAAKSAD